MDACRPFFSANATSRPPMCRESSRRLEYVLARRPAHLLRRRVQLGHLALAQPPPQRPQVIFQLSHRLHPRDGRGVLAQAPVDGNLRQRLPPLAANRPHAVQQTRQRRQHVFVRESPQPGRGVFRRVLTRQQPQRQRRVRDRAYPQLVARLPRAVQLGEPGQEVILHLERRDWHAPFRHVRVNLPQLLRAVVGQADGFDEPEVVRVRDPAPQRPFLQGLVVPSGPV
mmetsp:Transcript_1403/g.5510  ORF Transcript_1403/g.5510 Transcript_1403/m.5510 type:complete len:226 (+) Transcript_1403:238-915(+)